MNKKRSIFQYIYLGLFIFITALIFILASAPGDISSDQSSSLLNITIKILTFFRINLTNAQLSNLHVFIRKALGHFGIFLLDGIFGYLSVYYFTKFSPKTKFVSALGLGVFIAGLSEIIQMLAPERGPSFSDVLIDFAGFFVGVVFIILLLNKLNKKPLNKRGK